MIFEEFGVVREGSQDGGGFVNCVGFAYDLGKVSGRGGWDLGSFWADFWSFFDPKGRSERKARFSRNARNYNCFFMILRVRGRRHLMCLVPGATFSTSENRLGFFIDF